ncbi:MAG TPA: response regulator [Verrucomicrobiae bacterium]|nr:response regulator [Verrucomicrobiae bacterium]
MSAHATNFILYAEDDENDAFLVQHAFAKAGMNSQLVVVNSGKAAIEYLSCHALTPNPSTPLPRLILLDLNMPGTSGLEVLKWIRNTPQLSTLVVVMLTSSNQEADIHRAYIQGANGYLVKPSKVDELIVMVKAIKDFWLLQNRAHFPMSPAARKAE